MIEVWTFFFNFSLLYYEFYILKEIPFLIKNKNGSYSGYCVDIMDRIAQQLNLTYEIHVPDDKKYGVFENGSWNGMMKDLIDGV